MRITAEFVTSVGRLDQLPKDGLPEIALTGRSNVGKSSLINAVLGKPGLARTSSTPGRTQTLNYYRVTPDGKRPFFLVDMPGYGFAAASKASREQWTALVEQYLCTRPELRGVMQIIDLRHPPQPLDHNMAEWLNGTRQSFVIIGTKADKVPKSKVKGLIVKAAADLGVDGNDTMAFSAETGLGRDQVWRWVMEATNGG